MKSGPANIVFLSLILIFFSCGINHQDAGSACDENRLDSLTRVLSNYNAEGKYDSLVIVARGFLDSSLERGDTVSILYSGIYIAQAFLFMENADSVSHYLDLISRYETDHRDPRLGVTINNVLGIYAMKTGLNYSKALEYFQAGYDWTKMEEHSKSINHRITLLMNIVNIFYIRSDKHGMEYAREAYNLSKEENVGLYYKCVTRVAMAQMYYLSGDFSDAYRYITEADKMAEENGFFSLTPVISLVYADLYNHGREPGKAEFYYSRAMETAEFTDPGTVSLIYLHYGKFCEERQQFEKAIALYKQGLEISYTHVEFRRNLLQRLSDLYHLTGEKEISLDYYREYRAHLENVENTLREQEFNSQMLSYRQIQHEHEMQSKELALLKANRNIVIAVSILSIFLIISASLSWLYNRQRKMYRTLVAQHQNFMQRLNRGSLAEDLPDAEEGLTEKPEADRNLFHKVEELMREEKIYRQKDISLDKVAEYLKSNKSYISKAINTFVGISFNSYINMYRIGEATNIISNPGEDVPFKQLADDLGYNSVSVFYKAFQRETGCTPGRYRKEIEETQGKSGKKNIEDSSI